MKCCTRCGDHKPLDRFYTRKASRDGLTAACAECVRDAHARARAANPEPNRERARAWYRANRHRPRKKDPAAVQRVREWRLANPERHALAARAGRLRRRSIIEAGSALTVSELVALISNHDSRCVYCGMPYEHLDHIVPLSRGGAHTLSNLVPACASCNLSKGAKLISEWRPDLEFTS